jgi:cytochrome b
MRLGSADTAAGKAGVRVWDLPLRLCHWSLALAVAGAFVTAKIGGNAMIWHGRIGLTILGLLVFRIVWGFVGSTHARFASFVRGPAALRAYLRGQWAGAGHNPLGALSVLALLGLLTLQAATGLFANDDIAFQGQLYPLVGAAASERITGLHKAFELFLMVLVAAHVGAIAFYARVKGENLVKPMITGRKEVAAPHLEAPRGGGLAAFLLSVALAILAAWTASGALLPPPPPPAAAETPAW